VSSTIPVRGEHLSYTVPAYSIQVLQLDR
jgi:hypothetical protein